MTRCQEEWLVVRKVHTYDQSTVKPDAFWFGNAQINKELVNVREYLLVGDGVDDADCDDGAELDLGKGSLYLSGVWGLLVAIE